MLGTTNKENNRTMNDYLTRLIDAAEQADADAPASTPAEADAMLRSMGFVRE